MKANSDTVLFAKIITTLFIVGFAIIALLAISCTSRSGQYDKIPLEKVEILSMTSVDIDSSPYLPTNY